MAALWAWFLTRQQGSDAPPWAIPLLAAATWLLYASDRVLDSWGQGAQRDRHVFYGRHRLVMLPLIVAGSVALAGAAWTHLPVIELRADAALGAAVLLYFGWVHAGPAARGLPKTLAVAAIFALAVTIPAWALNRTDHAVPGLSGALFAALCWLNCVAIKRWERQTAVHPWARWAGARLRPLTLALALVACLALPLPAAAAVLVSALILAGLDMSRDRFTALQLRIAADAALLTPLLWLHR